MSKKLVRAKIDPAAAAKQADLLYVSDAAPGITRRRFGKGFGYYDPVGKKLTAKEVIERINALAIPPAYRDVWICPLENGHLQATGLDDAGRKQYRYHAKWGEVRDRAKYHHVVTFARALPKIRRAVRRDLKLPDLGRAKVLAAVVKVMDEAHIRVGNDLYAKDHQHFGLTTLLDEHVTFGRGGTMRFDFVGKSGKERLIDLKDPKLAAVVKACQDLPGQELFAYESEHGTGGWTDVSSHDVNAYLKEISGRRLHRQRLPHLGRHRARRRRPPRRRPARAGRQQDGHQQADRRRRQADRRRAGQHPGRLPQVLHPPPPSSPPTRTAA